MLGKMNRRCGAMRAEFFWVAHASRVLVAASGRNELVPGRYVCGRAREAYPKVRDDETSPPTHETRALPRRAGTLYHLPVLCVAHFPAKHGEFIPQFVTFFPFFVE